MWNELMQVVTAFLSSEMIQTASALFSAITLFFTFMQVKKISQTNAVNVITHCASRYDSLMKDLPKAIDAKQMDLWWYRLWDLWSEEFYFVRKGVLDKEIFSLWVIELALFYNLPPRNMSTSISTTQRESHTLYLSNYSPEDKIVAFFYKVAELSENHNSKDRAKAIIKLVRKL